MYVSNGWKKKAFQVFKNLEGLIPPNGCDGIALSDAITNDFRSAVISLPVVSFTDRIAGSDTTWKKTFQVSAKNFYHKEHSKRDLYKFGPSGKTWKV